MTLGIVTALTITSPAAGPPASSDWLAVAAAGDSAIGLGELVDSTSVWPSSIAESPRTASAVAAGALKHLAYMFEHKGDYLYAVVYVDTGSTWILDDATRVVLSYAGEEIESLEILLLGAEVPRSIQSSRDGIVVNADADLYRSRSGGYRGFVRFAPGSVPRSEWRFLWFGGTTSSAARPDSARLKRGG